jgi:hypothetical protein
MPFALLLAAAWAAAAGTDSLSIRPTVLCRLEGPVLALTHAGADRVLVLEDGRVSLWTPADDGLVRKGSVQTPVPVERVRHAAGLFHAPDDDGGWMLRSGWAEAALLSLDGEALAITSGADALPWPGAGKGVRFRSGTSLIEGPLNGLGDGPYVAVAPDGTAAVDPDGRLLLADHVAAADAPRVGSAVARPWPGLVVASSPAAPDAEDALLLIRLDPPHVVARLPVSGRIRAIAVRASGAHGTVLAAVESEGGTEVVRFDLRRPPGSAR